MSICLTGKNNVKFVVNANNIHQSSYHFINFASILSEISPTLQKIEHITNVIPEMQHFIILKQ